MDSLVKGEREVESRESNSYGVCYKNRASVNKSRAPKEPVSRIHRAHAFRWKKDYILIFFTFELIWYPLWYFAINVKSSVSISLPSSHRNEVVTDISKHHDPLQFKSTVTIRPGTSSHLTATPAAQVLTQTRLAEAWPPGQHAQKSPSCLEVKVPVLTVVTQTSLLLSRVPFLCYRYRKTGDWFSLFKFYKTWHRTKI